METVEFHSKMENVWGNWKISGAFQFYIALKIIDI